MATLLTRLPTPAFDDASKMASDPFLASMPGNESVAERIKSRIAFSPRNLLGLGIILLFAFLFAGWLFFSSAPQELSATAPPRQVNVLTTSEKAEPSSLGTSGLGEVVVDVAGKVRHPGVYHLPEGSRAEDAIVAAGGVIANADLSTINRAERLIDGTQLLVGIILPGSQSGSFGGPLSINRASLAELDALPGVGPVLASRIVRWRKAHGQFTSVAQLREVSGVGEAKFADLKPLVRL